MNSNNRGMTIAEMTVVLAIGAILLLAVMNVMSYLRINNQRATNMAESRIAISLGERYLWLHFKNADPSFNSLKGPDFLDDNNKNFYDLLPDADVNSLSTADKTRTVTLKIGGRSKFSVLIVNVIDRDVQNGVSPTFFADPVKFYSNILPSSTSGMGMAPFVDYVLFKNYVNDQNPNILTSVNKIIEIYSPITVRPPGLPAGSPPIPVSYFLRYGGGNVFIPETFGGAVNFVNAADDTIILGNFDDFLKTLPSSGGGIPPLMIRSIRFIQYELSLNPTLTKPLHEFKYRTWNGTAFVNPVLVATDVSSVVLTRKDIRDPLISAHVTMVKKEVN